MELDFNDIGYDDINSLLGLDLLMKAGYIIHLSKLQMNLNIGYFLLFNKRS